MEKKLYERPAIEVMAFQIQMIAQSVKRVSTNMDESSTLDWGGGGSDAARTKEREGGDSDFDWDLGF